MKALVVLLLLIPSAIPAQNNHAAIIDSFMKTEVAVNGFNGNVLVAKEGSVIYQQAFGFRNLDTRQPLDNNSVFELASISKQFTAAGILLLRDKGKLSLSDTLRKFFPELPYHNVTIWQLLVHCSGLPDYMEIMSRNWDHSRVAFNRDVIRVMAEQKVPPAFKPGTRWEYSNTGYMLLASVIEKVSGRSYNEFLAENIFRPLGMKRSLGYNQRRSGGDTVENYAYGFVYSDSLRSYIIPDSDPHYVVVKYLDGVQGDGTVNSTTGDLFLWDRALKNRFLLSDSSQQQMFARQFPMYGGFMHYGFGVMLSNGAPGASIFHSGGWPGYANHIVRYPERDLTIIVLTNNSGKPGSISSGIAQILYDRSFDFSYVHREVAGDSIFISKCVGKIFLPNSGPAELTMKNGKLFLTVYGRTVECKAESGSKFFYTDPVNRSIGTLEFLTNESGKVVNMIHTLNFVRSEIPKI